MMSSGGDICIVHCIRQEKNYSKLSIINNREGLKRDVDLGEKKLHVEMYKWLR